LRRSLFEMVFGQNILSIISRIFSVIHQYPEPYISFGKMQLEYNLSFVLVVYWLDLQTDCRFLNPILAFVNLCLLSFSTQPSVDTVLPKYVKISVCGRIWLFILTSDGLPMF
jgi:hypothetical protein